MLRQVKHPGPDSAAHLQKFTKEDLTKLTFGNSAFMVVGGMKVHVARGGYTGEDGFEVFFPRLYSFPSLLLSILPHRFPSLRRKQSL